MKLVDWLRVFLGKAELGMGDDEAERRDKLLTLEDGLCDLQILAVEAGAETTSALLRMAILDVRQMLGFPKKLDG